LFVWKKGNESKVIVDIYQRVANKRNNNKNNNKLLSIVDRETDICIGHTKTDIDIDNVRFSI